MKTPGEVIAFARGNGIRVVDFRFVDLPGIWQHFSIPVRHLTEELFENGIGFDGSSIRGFKEIHESDMILIPDARTAFVDAFTQEPTLNILCDVHDPITRQPYTRDPRYIARRAEEYLGSTGIADTAYFGPEAEFYIFDDVRFDSTTHSAFYAVDSSEAAWNTGRDERPNLGYKIRYKEGYFPVPPMDQFMDLRTEMMLELEKAGIETELHHHEVATAGQAEIDVRYDTLLATADKLMKFKYVVKNVARRNNRTVTFMPKPLFQDNGSGMHVHQSLWKDGRNLFWDERGYAGLSEIAIYYIGGLLKHAPSILAFAAPTTNSYRRLVPGYEAPINLIYSQRNRSACVRIPVYSKSPNAKRIEFRPPDPSSNPYLCFAALLMAGLDGIQNRIMPPEPIDKDLYDLPPEEKAAVESTPASLADALDALEADHDFLLKGDVFTEDAIRAWIDFKRKREVEQVALRPHPHEFALYYDI
ncbi:MAG TPA: type I glutamate--ammonia ligase [Armatimonadota bacterium]|nr:type I glutamate--ammonia ligase [Armatimonadota bacterium]HOJ22498.1 type I glutamate--ammonia ligase [Armatimonadota bacterium]HOM82490.1 type I glutamate--ammonia ligase [Armatimonadota bacterium]HOQ27920.1 type I glutamate--ammonia ligase [Armatimonadota bacterium]HPO74576.1 type I glutamate--ammonia ligase [Armatimonadota bacterium]